MVGWWGGGVVGWWRGCTKRTQLFMAVGDEYAWMEDCTKLFGLPSMCVKGRGGSEAPPPPPPPPSPNTTPVMCVCEWCASDAPCLRFALPGRRLCGECHPLDLNRGGCGCACVNCEAVAQEEEEED